LPASLSEPLAILPLPDGTILGTFASGIFRIDLQ
jgi:hypothetical protein